MVEKVSTDVRFLTNLKLGRGDYALCTSVTGPQRVVLNYGSAADCGISGTSGTSGTCGTIRVFVKKKNNNNNNKEIK